MNNDMYMNPKSSIMIYKYEKQVQHTYQEIRTKIQALLEHKHSIRMKDDADIQRYITFSFTEIKHANVLLYAIKSERQLPNEELQVTYHNICISKKGYLIITGMTDKNALLKYFSNLLHPQKYAFVQRYLTKKEILEITDKLLSEKFNKMYRPRFHFYKKYEGREFNDYSISETECATDDPKYLSMREECLYMEPQFKINKLNDDDFVTNLKINHRGLIYSSQRMQIDEWIAFVKRYIPWCL